MLRAFCRSVGRVADLPVFWQVGNLPHLILQQALNNRAEFGCRADLLVRQQRHGRLPSSRSSIPSVDRGLSAKVGLPSHLDRIEENSAAFLELLAACEAFARYT